MQREAAQRHVGAGKEGGAGPAGAPRPGQGTDIERRLADLEAENRNLRTAAGVSEPPAAVERVRLPPKAAEELAADQRVTELEASLATLRTCRHPGRDQQIADLERHIAWVREEARTKWSPPRLRQRLEARLQDAKTALEKSSTRQAELAQQQEELSEEIAAAAEKVAKQAAALAEHQAALDSFDQAAQVPGAVEGDAVAVADQQGPAGSSAAAGQSAGPTWQRFQLRVQDLCRTGLPAEDALHQATTEASSTTGLRFGAAEELELDDPSVLSADSDVEFGAEDDDDIFAEFADDPADVDATFTRSQLREILAKQRGRVKAATKEKRRSGAVRQPAFAKRFAPGAATTAAAKER